MRKLFRLVLRTAVLAAIAGMLFLAATPSMAAINTGTGSIAGVPADLTDSDDFVLNTTTLQLIKRAYLADGTVIPDGSSLPKGTVVKFIIYVNNNTILPVDDVSIQDALAGAFAYTANSIKQTAAFGRASRGGAGRRSRGFRTWVSHLSIQLLGVDGYFGPLQQLLE